MRQILAEFSCEKNQDVEDFLKRQAIDFTNKHQFVTYLVFATDDAQLLGYFALTIKPISVSGEPFSNTVCKKLSRVSKLDEKEHTYSLAAYLIAQLGKNDTAFEAAVEHIWLFGKKRLDILEKSLELQC